MSIFTITSLMFAQFWSYANLPLGLLFVFSWFITLLEEVMNISYNPQLLLQSNDLSFLLTLFVGVPIVEESVFRSTLVAITKSLSYYQELNAVLYGIVHFWSPGSFGYRISKVVLSAIMGFYLVKLDNILLAILIHMAFNITLHFLLHLYKNALLKSIDLSKLQLEVPETINFGNQDMVAVPIKKFKRSKSSGDLRNDFTELRFIKKDEIDEDMLESFEKLSEICRNRNADLQNNTEDKENDISNEE